MSSAHTPVRKPAKRALAHRNLPLLLLHARESVIAHFRPVLNEHGVTEQQWRIVRALLEHGPLEPRQIVQLCRISSPSLAGVLARMDELGLVQRQRLEHDQRRVHVTATARSRALAASMAPRVEAVYAAMEARLGADFIQGVYAMLDALVSRLGDVSSVEETPAD
jgi:homoprotocatechuate degradation regulator HpaR